MLRMLASTTALLALALLCLAPAIPAQTITIGTGTSQNTTYTYPTPYGNYWSGMRAQYLFQAAELNAAGVPGGAPIYQLAWDVVAVGGQPLQAFEIRMGHTTMPDLSLGWAGGPFTTVYGPLTYADTVGWNTHTLTTPFAWNGIDSLVIEICFWNGVNNWTTNAVVNRTPTTFVSALSQYDDYAPPCTSGLVISNFDMVRPNIQLGLTGTHEWQTNAAGLSIDIDGVQTDGILNPAVVNKSLFTCAPVNPATGVLNLSSNLPGYFWEMALTPAVLLPASGGALISGSGQIINVNLFAPGLTFFNGLGPVPVFTPLIGGALPGATSVNLSIGFAASTVVDLSLQGIILNAAAPDGFVLSQASELHVAVTLPPASVLGPTGDDISVSVDVTAAPTCWVPGGINIYGANYSTLNVASNGRVLFGGQDDDYSPSLLEALGDNPFVGCWTDLNPFSGGTITISNPLPGIVKVDYTAVPYFNSSTTVTYAIEFDTNTNDIFLRGLTGIVPNPSTALRDMFLGMSPGNLLGATDPGSTTFSAGGGAPAASTTAMLYDYGIGNTLPTSLTGTPALNYIQFMPSASVAPNYDWLGF